MSREGTGKVRPGTRRVGFWNERDCLEPLGEAHGEAESTAVAPWPLLWLVHLRS